MSIYDFNGYLSPPRQSLGGKLIGFNAKTGMPVKAAAGVGSYAELSTDFYKTFQPDNWQHAGSEGWTQAPVPGWGENPNLQMFPRRAVNGVGDVGMEGLGYVLGALMLGAGATLYFSYKKFGAKGLGIAAGSLGTLYFFIKRREDEAQKRAIEQEQKAREWRKQGSPTGPKVERIG